MLVVSVLCLHICSKACGAHFVQGLLELSLICLLLLYFWTVGLLDPLFQSSLQVLSLSPKKGQLLITTFIAWLLVSTHTLICRVLYIASSKFSLKSLCVVVRLATPFARGGRLWWPVFFPGLLGRELSSPNPPPPPLTFKVVANKDLGRQRKWILIHQHCTTCLPHAKSRFSTMSTIPISSYRRAH